MRIIFKDIFNYPNKDLISHNILKKMKNYKIKTFNNKKLKIIK